MGTYHHGDLRRQLLDLAATIAAEEGIESVTLRALARRAGVSHSAPVHHFGSRRNLLTALAAEGFSSLNRALEEHPDDIHEMGVDYVLWALEHPGHYAVMWQPHDLAVDDEHLSTARDRAWSLLARAVGDDAADTADATGSLGAVDHSPGVSAAVARDGRIDAYAAFSVVHGLAGLWLSGVLPRPEEPTLTIREVTRRFVLGR